MNCPACLTNPGHAHGYIFTLEDCRECNGSGVVGDPPGLCCHCELPLDDCEIVEVSDDEQYHRPCWRESQAQALAYSVLIPTLVRCSAICSGCSC